MIKYILYFLFLSNLGFASSNPLLEKKYAMTLHEFISPDTLLDQIKRWEELKSKSKITLQQEKNKVDKQLDDQEKLLDQSIKNYIFNNSEKTAKEKAQLFNNLEKTLLENQTHIVDSQENCCCFCYSWSGRSQDLIAKDASYFIDQRPLVVQKALLVLALDGESDNKYSYDKKKISYFFS